MTDNDIMQVLHRIHKMCRKRMYNYEPFHPMCQGCVFEVYKPSKRRNTCQVTQLLGHLSARPHEWDMEVIEEVLKK